MAEDHEIRDKVIETHIMVKSIHKRMDEQNQKISDHEMRIRKSEGVLSKAVAIASVFSVLLTSSVYTLMRKLLG